MVLKLSLNTYLLPPTLYWLYTPTNLIQEKFGLLWSVVDDDLSGEISVDEVGIYMTITTTDARLICMPQTLYA